ncbi:FecR family protein [Chitinophaga sp. MM2321]|uniref:FecR family protein n=1 Tax=Chitinophaga sp. MM2321 TaxID=3137178 RepID=UPI0032D59972
MEQERIWLLLGRKVSGEATMAELRELEELLQQFPELRYKFSVLSSWQVPAPCDEWTQKTTAALEKHLLKMEAAFPQDLPVIPVVVPPAPKAKSRIGVMAVLSLLVVMLGSYCIFLLMNKDGETKKDEIAEIQTHNGSRSKAVLPDGSEIWLNGGSKLTYNPAMNKKGTREVFLSGEAFFNVARNADKPFIIRTSTMEVKVLGTSFNVKAYPGDKTAETSLISGVVEVTPHHDASRRIRLAPNQKIIIRGTQEGNTRPGLGYSIENIKQLPEDNMIGETAWRDNILVFDNERFEDIALKMERWYDIKIHLTNNKLKNYHFTGTFKNESFPEILEALKVTTSFHCRITGNEVFINP